MTLRTWGRKPDPRKLATAKKYRQMMYDTVIYGSGAGVVMMIVAALAWR